MSDDKINAMLRGRRRWLRTHAPTESVPLSLLGGGLLYAGAAYAKAGATRAEKRTWRRRVSRAWHTKHTQRRVIPFSPIPFGQGAAIGLSDRDNDYPVITRAPWLRRHVDVAQAAS